MSDVDLKTLCETGIHHLTQAYCAGKSAVNLYFSRPVAIMWSTQTWAKLAMHRCDRHQHVDCHIDSLIVMRKSSRGKISQGHWSAFMIASDSLLVRTQISLNQNPCTTNTITLHSLPRSATSQPIFQSTDKQKNVHSRNRLVLLRPRRVPPDRQMPASRSRGSLLHGGPRRPSRRATNGLLVLHLWSI